MLLSRKKIGKLKGLSYSEMHKIIKNLPDKIIVTYKERKTGGKYDLKIYRKHKYEIDK